jgi:hypothetical protein
MFAKQSVCQRVQNKSLCGSAVNITVNYKTTYELEKLDDGKVYMIFRDYECDIMPQLMVTRLENMFNGNKFLGKLSKHL